MERKYLHGYDDQEKNRLSEQAGFLEEMIYEFLDASACRKMLEIGCGTGGQSKILLETYPLLSLESFDVSEEQIATAKTNFSVLPHLQNRINFSIQDANQIQFEDDSFDSVFIVWVLEHSNSPSSILKEAHRVLKPGGKIFITEVHNRSLYIYPKAPFQLKFFDKFNELQIEMGGDPFVGVKLGNLLNEAGFDEILTRNLKRHFDNRDPDRRAKMFDYWAELLVSAKENLINAGKIDETFVEKTLKEIEEIKNTKGAIFYYSPIQAEAIKK